MAVCQHDVGDGLVIGDTVLIARTASATALIWTRASFASSLARASLMVSPFQSSYRWEVSRCLGTPAAGMSA
jgi:hypothetical protein